MKTPYLDKEIEILEKDQKAGKNSFYQNMKLQEYKSIKRLTTKTD